MDGASGGAQDVSLSEQALRHRTSGRLPRLHRVNQLLEFIEDIPSAIAEIRRIAALKGTIVLGFPGKNFITRLGYLLARSQDPRRVHRANYRMILDGACRYLKLLRLLRFPSFLPPRLALYFIGECEQP